MADRRAPPDPSLYSSIPIPTYEEATSSSRLSSSQTFLGPSEVSHDAERQGLLYSTSSAAAAEGRDGHQRPTFESARSDFDVDLLPSSGENSARASMESLHREMSEMEVLDPDHASGRSTLSKRISSSLSSLQTSLPFLRRFLPSSVSLPSIHLSRSSFSLSSIRERLPSFVGAPHVELNFSIVLRVMALVFIVSVGYLIFFADIFRIKRPAAHMYDPEQIRQYILDHVDEQLIRQNLEYITSYDHVAGTEGSFVLGKWVQEGFLEAGMNSVEMERFDVYLNYPTTDGRKVEIVEPEDKKWVARLEEEAAYPDREQTMAFHGHSRSGNVTGHLVYANYGAREDFQRLKELGVRVEGSIALVRYYGTQGDRALKVKAAEMAGAVGCIIYSDPKEDGFVNGPTVYEGRYRSADSVQRGSVSLMSWVVGDVLSPGVPSLPGQRLRGRLDNNPGLNNIPSIPLSARDAQPLLQSIKGLGQRLQAEDQAWKGWIGGVPDVEWWTGSADSPTVHLQNFQDEVMRQPIYNVIGRIEGAEQPDAKIIVGNHRDAWCFGGVDPGSGTAVLMEVVRIFGELTRAGWRPARTIEFASWDAEEYNLIGSTEHVENRMTELRDGGVAYLNVDVAVLGDDFRASASPLLQKPLLRTLDRVWDPKRNATLRKLWAEAGRGVEGLGAGSDYVAFQDIVGVSSIDMGFHGEPFPYHSCYDNFKLVDGVIDPDFAYHKLMAQVWALLIVDLSDSANLPFDMEVYAESLGTYLNDLTAYVEEKTRAGGSQGGRDGTGIDIGSLLGAIDELKKSAQVFEAFDKAWDSMIQATGGFENNIMQGQRLDHNKRAAKFEKALLDVDGGLSIQAPPPPPPFCTFPSSLLLQSSWRELASHLRMSA